MKAQFGQDNVALMHFFPVIVPGAVEGGEELWTTVTVAVQDKVARARVQSRSRGGRALLSGSIGVRISEVQIEEVMAGPVARTRDMSLLRVEFTAKWLHGYLATLGCGGEDGVGGRDD